MSIFLQGHPEYWHDDLAKEYERDKSSGQLAPANYYVNHGDTPDTGVSWRPDAQKLFENVKHQINQQSLGL